MGYIRHLGYAQIGRRRFGDDDRSASRLVIWHRRSSVVANTGSSSPSTDGAGRFFRAGCRTGPFRKRLHAGGLPSSSFPRSRRDMIRLTAFRRLEQGQICGGGSLVCAGRFDIPE